MVPVILMFVLGTAAFADWRADIEKGKQAYAKQQIEEALAAFRSAELAAREAKDSAALIESLRLQATVLRGSGNAAEAGRMLSAAAAEFADTYGEDSVEVAILQEEIALTGRALGNAGHALEALGKAIAIRELRGPRADFARDLATSAMLRVQAGEAEQATALLARALEEWDAANPGDPQCLPALEALANLYRDQAKYAEAEPLLLRALRQREAAGGPLNAESIAAVDSLAYVEFGLRKMPEAEALYLRLLDLWEKNAGPDHPMVALTLDKMAEFYAFEQRYDEAEKAAARSLELRMKMHIASLHQTGRVLLMSAKVEEAASLYSQTIAIGDLAHASDEVLDPSLRVYAKILNQLGRDKDAETIEKRVKEALLKKADREGRRPSPVKLRPAKPPTPGQDRTSEH